MRRWVPSISTSSFANPGFSEVHHMGQTLVSPYPLSLGLCFACAVAIYRMGNRAKNPGKMGKKWHPAWNSRKMATEIEKIEKNGQTMAKLPFWGPFFHFWAHFSAISGQGPFSSFFPIFPGFLCRTGFPFCRWPPRTQAMLPLSSRGPENTGKLKVAKSRSDSRLRDVPASRYSPGLS